MPSADVDSTARRPTGEDLVTKVMDCLEQEAAKPSTLARQLVLPPPEVAQAFRVAEARGWIERTADGRYRPTGTRETARGAA
jgi:DNA-binding IclR family transcriptional regulator